MNDGSVKICICIDRYPEIIHAYMNDCESLYCFAQQGIGFGN